MFVGMLRATLSLAEELSGKIRHKRVGITCNYT